MTKFDFNDVDICIYHKNCRDGFCSAFIVWNIAGYDKNNNIEFVGMQPSTKITEQHLKNFTDQSVLVVDLSFSREDCLKIQKVAKQFLIIDHHKTAADDLEGLDCAIFNMGYSGAGLLWKTLAEYWIPPNDATPLHADVVPILVEYVQDRDLGHNVLPHTKEINAWIRTVPFDFMKWAQLNMLLDDSSAIHAAIIGGNAIIKHQTESINQHSKVATEIQLYTEPNMKETVKAMVTCNVPSAMMTEVGYAILKDNADVQLVVMPVVLPWGTTIYSMRAREGFDASVIAKAWGGGGHPGACGFSAPIANGFPWKPISDKKLKN